MDWIWHKRQASFNNSSLCIWRRWKQKGYIPSICRRIYNVHRIIKKVSTKLSNDLFNLKFTFGFISRNFHSIIDQNLEAIGSDFAIDASYELALVVGQKIQHLPLKFCLKLSPDCVVHPLSERSECVSTI